MTQSRVRTLKVRKTLVACGTSVGAAILFVTGMVHAPSLRAQSSAAPTFEVASIRPSASAAPQRFSLFPNFGAQNSTLRDLFTLAYDVKRFQVSGGPKWFDSDRYDIEAKALGAPTPGPDGLLLQKRRLQTLLQERFKLAIHREMRELPLYELTIARGGHKLQPTTCIEPDSKNPGPAPGKTVRDYCGWSGFFPGRFEGSTVSMTDLAKALANILGRTVVDKTAIKGSFHVQLTFAPDDAAARAIAPGGDPRTTGPGADLGPNIFTAIQEQLGLKLESSKGPVEVLVIDHVEKPTEN